MKVENFFDNGLKNRTQEEIVEYLRNMDNNYIESIDLMELKEIETLILDLYKHSAINKVDVVYINELLEKVRKIL